MGDGQERLKEVRETIHAIRAGGRISYGALVQYRQWHDEVTAAGGTPQISIEQARTACNEPKPQPPTVTPQAMGEIRERELRKAREDADDTRAMLLCTVDQGIVSPAACGECAQNDCCPSAAPRKCQGDGKLTPDYCAAQGCSMCLEAD